MMDTGRNLAKEEGKKGEEYDTRKQLSEFSHKTYTVALWQPAKGQKNRVGSYQTLTKVAGSAHLVFDFSTAGRRMEGPLKTLNRKMRRNCSGNSGVEGKCEYSRSPVPPIDALPLSVRWSSFHNLLWKSVVCRTD